MGSCTPEAVESNVDVDIAEFAVETPVNVTDQMYTGQGRMCKAMPPCKKIER